MSKADSHGKAIERYEEIGRRLGWISGNGADAVRTELGQQAYDHWLRLINSQGDGAASEWLREQYAKVEIADNATLPQSSE